ncbi:MAG: hypothetical protein IJX49_00665 [Clostridia bacterium]|nr:hypothetical protein [Clostridia bacterium]
MAKRKLSKISIMHFSRLFLRSALLIAALILYVINRVQGTGKPFGTIGENHFVIGAVWLLFAVEMVFRFFPAKFESMGCQKQFKGNYKPKAQEGGKIRPQKMAWWRTFLSAAVWFALNGVFGVLYYAGIFDEGILVLISLAYAVCDMICVLFFCPFQTWIMRNKCCTACRIYNWDYAMMFTPLVFFKSFWGWSILGLSLLLLLEWELLYRFYPERFAENTNCSLSCANCKEKLCHHKKQLRGFLKDRKNRERNAKNSVRE